jgi:hypothetical protein
MRGLKLLLNSTISLKRLALKTSLIMFMCTMMQFLSYPVYAASPAHSKQKVTSKHETSSKHTTPGASQRSHADKATHSNKTIHASKTRHTSNLSHANKTGHGSSTSHTDRAKHANNTSHANSSPSTPTRTNAIQQQASSSHKTLANTHKPKQKLKVQVNRHNPGHSPSQGLRHGRGQTTPHVSPSAPHPSTKVDTENISVSHLPGYLLSSIEKTLVNFVRSSIESIRYTAYKLGGTRIDSSRGVYVVDCSSYVDHILKTVYPHAYTSLASWSGSEKPTTNDYYQYFMNLSDNSRHWNTVDDVEELRPGDILVFRTKNRFGNEIGGHVMIVMDKPIKNGNTFLVRIADAAPSGHSKDTRLPHASGIGIGTMLLKVNPQTFQPYAYAWKVGARWESNVNFAMARPIDLG